ncbi:aldo/keto reductase [Iamia majanohamensis]|uniref:Aldo/keto reductase n=1 Tax=Iamia majanohamensis TaxID=467976 RepID=A0AAE9YGZ9_9ACTN|nr:aldo/keto reductase [Iamia majanohamensis]WCO68312.1 aldo/keto reductase [Iamia majanohamensis]
MPSTTPPDAAASGTFRIAGELPVHRLGFGAMRITGEGIWGPPPDREAARAVVRRAVELGTTLIDTADSYGPDVSEEIIGEALRPYPEDVVVATKAGLTRSGPGEWTPCGRPDHIRAACEGSLKRLGLDTIPLYQLHRIDPEVPVEDSLGTMVELREEGKVRHIGVSEVTVDELHQCQALTPIATVQNRYNLVDREWEDVLDVCTSEGIGFIPWFPLATGSLAEGHDALSAAAERLDVAPGAVALAWLLERSPVVLPIPGTGSTDHLEQNVAAAGLRLTDEERTALDAAVAPGETA